MSYSARAEAYKKALIGKRDKKRIKEFTENPQETIDDMYDWVLYYKPHHHTPITINDGITKKKRKILVPCFQELCIQHLIVKQLEPMFYQGMYEHSYASIPNRGAHKGKKQIEKWIKYDSKNCKYVFKGDIHHFFPSINHDILKAKLAKKIKDEQFLDLVYKVIDTTKTGLPIGFYTSQWFSNWYLMEFDHFVKEQLHAVHYIRYMDDIVIFGSNKRKLHKMVIEIQKYLKEKLDLELKDNWQVYRFDYIKHGKHYGRDVDFMGFRFYRNKTLLRKSILCKARRKANKIAKKDKPTIYDCKQMVSYIGWLDYTNTYNYYLHYIKPKINFQQLKRRISAYDRKIQKRKREQTANN